MKYFGLILLVLSVSLLCAEGNYQFEVRVHSYIHSNRRDWENHYCDVFSNNPCENLFYFCLQRHGHSQTNSYCEFGSITTTRTWTSTSLVNFDEGANIFGQGINNPLVFRGSGPWLVNFQFQIRVNDDDHPDSDDLIDRVFAVETNFPISENFTPRRTYTGNYGNVRFDLSYRAICQTNYYGSTCTVFCIGRDDSTGHYSCNSNGDRVCLPGWSDLPNNCLTAVCEPTCQTNSECTAPDVCACVSGWTGQNCTQCIPATGCEHGSCVNPGECECEAGYSGTVCQIDVDVCGHQTPCQNGGNCSNTGPDSYSCACPATYNGPNCDEDVDECLSDPCKNGATCVNHIGDVPTCICAGGYTGPDCGTEIDECASSPCQNGATCNDLLDNFNCTCAPGFNGAVCDNNIDDCHPDFCLRGGTCVDQVNGYTCDCLPRYTGSQCEDEVAPPCSSSPCPQGTFCIGNIDANNFTCESCLPGVEGCSNTVLVDPDAQKGSTTSALIGGIVGGVVAALLLLCCIVAMAILCLRCCTCCPCVAMRRKEDETYEAIGTSAQQNPLYLGTSTLLSSQSGTLRSSSASMPRYDRGSPAYVEFTDVASGEAGVETSPVRQHTNPMYALAQDSIYSGTPSTLPAARRSPEGRPVSPDHYERLPGDNIRKETVASGKYDRLKPEPLSPSCVIHSGKYDSLSPTSAPVATGNLYVIERGDGYRVIPGEPRPLNNRDTAKPTAELEETSNAPIPPTKFNPYD